MVIDLAPHPTREAALAAEGDPLLDWLCAYRRERGCWLFYFAYDRCSRGEINPSRGENNRAGEKCSRKHSRAGRALGTWRRQIRRSVPRRGISVRPRATARQALSLSGPQASPGAPALPHIRPEHTPRSCAGRSHCRHAHMSCSLMGSPRSHSPAAAADPAPATRERARAGAGCCVAAVAHSRGAAHGRRGAAGRLRRLPPQGLIASCCVTATTALSPRRFDQPCPKYPKLLQC